MSSIVVAGDTSGSVTISAPAVAGTTVLTLPTTNGTVIVGTGGITGVAQGGTGLSSVGTSGNVLTSNGTAWVSSAPAASGPVLKFVTDSTDIALTADPSSTYYNFGSSFSVSIPTTGIIRIASFVGRIQNNTNSQGGGPTFGIRIGSTNYWLCKSTVQAPSTTTRYGALVLETYAVGSTYEEMYGQVSTATNAQYSKPHTIDIAYNSIPTGTQTVQLICAKTNYTYTDNVTIKGTAITTKVGIEFVSAS
jgi:hypothetical protein